MRLIFTMLFAGIFAISLSSGTFAFPTLVLASSCEVRPDLLLTDRNGNEITEQIGYVAYVRTSITTGQVFQKTSDDIETLISVVTEQGIDTGRPELRTKEYWLAQGSCAMNANKSCSGACPTGQACRAAIVGTSHGCTCQKTS